MFKTVVKSLLGIPRTVPFQSLDMHSPIDYTEPIPSIFDYSFLSEFPINKGPDHISIRWPGDGSRRLIRRDSITAALLEARIKALGVFRGFPIWEPRSASLIQIKNLTGNTQKHLTSLADWSGQKQLNPAQHAELLEHVVECAQLLSSVDKYLSKFEKPGRKTSEHLVVEEDHERIAEYRRRLRISSLQLFCFYQELLKTQDSTTQIPVPRNIERSGLRQTSQQTTSNENATEEIQVCLVVPGRQSTDTMSTMSIPAPPYALT